MITLEAAHPASASNPVPYVGLRPFAPDERDLFYERQIRSVTANTRDDGHRFFAEASVAGVQVRTVTYPFDGAAAALTDLWHDRINGAAVLVHDR